MYDLSEESVARLLIRDAQQLADRAKDRNRCDSLCTEAFAQGQTKWTVLASNSEER